MGVIGGTILLLGIVMFISPGPGIVVLPIGLAVLGLEFVWAIRWLRKIERGAGGAKDRFWKWWAKPRRA